MSALRSLSEEQVQSFRLNGFLTVEGVLTGREVAMVAERLDLIAAGQAEHVPLWGTVRGEDHLEQ